MKKVLEDIKVLDLTDHWFGPFCTMMLADLGAEVIKIEPPWGAVGRFAEPPLSGGVSHTFHHLNLNKKDMAINMKDPKGLEIFKELVKRSDVVVQNFAPGTMERLGLGYDVLKKLNPRIIYAALSGFGQTGPYSQRGSFAEVVEAMSGHSRLTGDNIDPEGPPVTMAQAYGDLGPALFSAMSIIAAIRYRDKTGLGQMIDVAQFDCMVALNTAITGYTLSGMKPWELWKKDATVRTWGRILQTKDGGWIFLAPWRAKAIDKFKEVHNVEEITKEIVEEIVGGMTRDEAVNYMLELGFPVGPVYHVDEVIEDPQLAARGMFIGVDHPRAGEITVPNFPVKFSEMPVEIISAAPLLGQNNKEILIKLLGYTEKQIDELEKKGVIVTEKPNIPQ